MKDKKRCTRFLGAVFVFIQLCVVAAPGADQVEADTLFVAQQWVPAALAYAALVKQEPVNPRFWYRLGRSQLELSQYPEAIASLENVLENNPDEQVSNRTLFSLTRAYAGAGNRTQTLAKLEALVQADLKIYSAVSSAPELARYVDDAAFVPLLEQLKPCGTQTHRAFDFWLGEWTVTAPSRPGWSAQSSITRHNDGCSIHEAYHAAGGFQGSSINFYDEADQKWHQTWIDNQGGALYLVGDRKDGEMVLSDSGNRITWTALDDGRVRQHWESTTDDGETWTTAFDGYYVRRSDAMRHE